MAMQQKLIEDLPPKDVGHDGPARFPQDEPELLHKVIRKLFWIEYLLVPVFYALGKFGCFRVSMVIQLFFILFSGTAQWMIYQDHKRWNSIIMDPEEAELSGNVQSILGVPVGWLHIPKVLFEFVAQVPNYVHVQQTAVVTAASYATWTPSLQQEWVRRWEVGLRVGGLVGWMGGLVGWMGVPDLLLAILVLSACVHGIMVVFFDCLDAPDLAADAANLLFLGKVVTPDKKRLHMRAVYGVSDSRFVVALACKLPMLYVKTSLTTIGWECAAPQVRAANLFAVGLAWYAFLPATKVMKQAGIDCCYLLCCGPAVALLAASALHILGIFTCASHDLAITRPGCTPASGLDFCAFGTVNTTAP